MDAQVIAFATTAAIIVISPGPGAALIASVAMSHGRRAATLVVAGLMSALVIYASLAIGGASRWLLNAPDALRIVRYGGGMYLIYIGVRSVADGWRTWSRPNAAVELRERPAPQQHAFVVSGLLTALANPALLVLYLVVIPRFAPASLSAAHGAAVLSGIHIAIACIWNGALALALAAVPRRAGGGSGALAIAAGLCLVYLGVATAAGP